jgi:Cellobiose phosphorylase
MTLTGQVFPILSGVASNKQVRQIFRATNKFLKDKRLGGFRLNTDFKAAQPDLGRAFAFAYGEKENGAIFSHMCVMFAKALYQRNFVREGYTVLESLFALAVDSPTSKIYPCLPEYFNGQGRGMYSYLTGSASWYIMTLLTEVFGVKGHFGDLVIAPKLIARQFKDSETISLSCFFAERRISVIIKNPRKLDYENYHIVKVSITPEEVPVKKTSSRQVKIKRSDLLALDENSHTTIELLLG